MFFVGVSTYNVMLQAFICFVLMSNVYDVCVCVCVCICVCVWFICIVQHNRACLTCRNKIIIIIVIIRYTLHVAGILSNQETTSVNQETTSVNQETTSVNRETTSVNQKTSVNQEVTSVLCRDACSGHVLMDRGIHVYSYE